MEGDKRQGHDPPGPKGNGPLLTLLLQLPYGAFEEWAPQILGPGLAYEPVFGVILKSPGDGISRVGSSPFSLPCPDRQRLVDRIEID